MIPIYKPYLTKYKSSSIQAISDEWISNYGMYVPLSEEKLCEIYKSKFCILTNNGTSATHCLFLALKYRYPDIKTIYVPNNVFVAAWNCALMEYDKSQLKVMKMNPDTFNIDTSEEYIKSLEKNACILIVHNLGNIVNVPRLKRLRPDLIFIEDNCEGFFGKYENKYSGTSIDCMCSSISFYANKTLTTGEGGAFLTNDNDIYLYIKSIYSHGMSEERYIHNFIAYNYRMTNIQAALLYEQLKDVKHIIDLKRDIFKNYDMLFDLLIQEKSIVKIQQEHDTVQADWMYCIIIPRINFKRLECFLDDHKVQIRPFFYDIRRHKHLSDIHVDYDEVLQYKYGIMLPSFPELTIEEQTYVANCIKKYILHN